MAEYLYKLQLIVSNTEFKNKAEAYEYETPELKAAGEAYVRAILKTDIFESYQYNSKTVYNILHAYGLDDVRIMKLIETPHMIPQTIKNELMSMARKSLISSYVERNKYYANLAGLPFPGNDTEPAEKILTIPDEFYKLYQDDGVIERNHPVHEMPLKYQELFMNSPYYQQMIDANPSSKYLKYIGSNAIPIEISRKAHDGEIMCINTNKLSTYHKHFGNVTVGPDVIHEYVNSYNEARKYVYDTLRGDFSSIYPNYDSFIRFLTICLSIGNALNEFMKKSSEMIHMNNSTANNFFMLYGLPSVIMEGTSMIEFLKKFRMILMDKGTNIVYRVKDLIGYEYTDIYTLVMVKQQVFENGMPVFTYDKDGNRRPKQNIMFRRLGTTDDNTSYFKYRESNVSYTVDEITSGDPRWWNTPEVEEMLQEMNYTLSNSKYIQLSTHLSMQDIWWQCVIVLRGLLDRHQETKFAKMAVNFNINGSSELSVFEAVLTLVILMHWHLHDYTNNPMSGNLYLPNAVYNGQDVCLDLLFNGLKPDGSPKELVLGLPYKISSFNFDFREEHKELYQSMKDMEYLEPETFLPMLDKVLDREYSNIGEVLMTDVKLIYKYLETKLRTCEKISEFRQVTDVFSRLFLVNPIRKWYDGVFTDVESVILKNYDMSVQEFNLLKNFFQPNDEDGEPDMTILYAEEKEEYPLYIYDILNQDVLNICIHDTYPFRNDSFVSNFIKEMNNFESNELLSSYLSNNIKQNYRNIIIDKVMLDVGNSSYGPKTFESLLFQHNSSLYRYVLELKNNPEGLVLLMRSIIKSLESYTDNPLTGLEFNALGVDEYFRILKEVISYFKSYMVEFTKDEFVYIFDGLFDQGGNSNMLKLCDEISSGSVVLLPKDSLTMYDVSCATMKVKMRDEFCSLHDEAIIRVKATYQKILDSGYEVWYDDGERITQNPSFEIAKSTEIIANLTPKPNTDEYMIIINKNNVDIIPPNYIGNVRKID